MRPLAFLFASVTAFGLVCCVGDSPTANDAGSDATTSDADLTGTEGHACFGNSTCLNGLTCISNVCVNLDSGTSSDSGTDGNTDAATGIYVIRAAHANGGSPVTIPAFDTGTGANRLLLVGVSLAPNGVSNSPTFQVTFNGMGLTSLTTADRTPTYDCSSRILFMKAPMGAGNVVVTFGGVQNPEYAVVGALALGGVVQTATFGAPVSAQGNQGSMALAVATGMGHMTFVNNCNNSGSNITPQAGMVPQWGVNASNMGGAGSTGTGSASVTHTWVQSVGTDWVSAGVDILPAP